MTGWSPVKGVLPTMYRIRKHEGQARLNKRAVDPLIIIIIIIIITNSMELSTTREATQ
jgi:hypothetical protein